MSPQRKPRPTLTELWQRWRFLSPIIAVSVVFLCVNTLRDSVQLRADVVTFCVATASAKCASISPVVFYPPGTSLDLVARDLSGRLQLAAAATVFLIAFATLMCLCAAALFQCRRAPSQGRSRLLVVLGAVLVSGVVVWLAATYDSRQISLLLKPFEDLANTVLANTHVGLAWTNRLTGLLSILSAVVLAVTAAVIVDGVSSHPSQLADLRTRCSALRLTLTAGAAVLASAVIVVRTLQYWTLSFVDNADVLRQIADSWTLALGTYWTLVLLAAYVPAAAVLHSAAIAMADAHTPAQDDRQTREQWLEDRNLNVTIKGQVVRALLLLAPFLSGGALAEIAGAFLK
jgi:hypothetical protein